MTDWSLALCRQADPEAFFPASGGNPRPAKRVCASCEIRLDCLEVAMQDPEVHGVWGGTTQSERRRMRQTFRDTPATRT